MSDMHGSGLTQTKEAFLDELDSRLRVLNDPHEVHRIAAHALGVRLNVDRCLYAVMLDDDDSFDVIGNYHLAAPTIVGRHRLSGFGTSVVEAMRQGQPWSVDNVGDDERLSEVFRETFRTISAAAGMCAPLWRDGQFVAFMAVHSVTPRRWSAEEMGLLVAVANRCWESIERARAERAARARENRFRALVEDSSQILWIAGLNGQIVEDSPSWRAFTGQSYEEFCGSGWTAAIHPEDFPDVMARTLEGVARQQGVDLEFRLRRASGDWAWVSEQIRPVRDPDGTLQEWVGLITDVSARKNNERGQVLLLQLDDSIRPMTQPEAIAGEGTRLLCEFLQVERSAYLDVAADQNTGTPLRDYAPQMPALGAGTPLRDYAPQMPALGGVHFMDDYGKVFADDMRSGRPHVLDDVARASLEPAVRQRYAALGIGAMINIPLRKDGRVVAIMGVYQAAPRAWTATERDLVLAVVNRCWESIERARITRELREADQRKDQFLATLAHELRNPLAPLQNALMIARDARSTLPPGRLFDLMDRQIQQLVRLVDDLLDISRISRGAIELKPETLPLDQILNTAIETAKPAIALAEHHLDIESAGALYVRGDSVRLTQIFANLLNNAAKYTPPRGHIRVSVQTLNDTVAVSVRDDGIGIAKDMQQRVFDMFTQVSQSRGHLQGGLGIGLSLVRNLVQLHGGSIEVFSDGNNLGSEFVVTLPLVAANRTLPAEAEDAVRLQGLRLLVVDDNRDSADSVGVLLRMMGADVTVCYSPLKALALIGGARPDLAFLDIGMPEMDGYALAREIRALPAFHTMQLVALTGWGQEGDRRRSREAGFDHHLTKPVDMGELERVLAPWLSVSGEAAPPTR
ncbi:hybrid sensor histidine kinase/response regulator [Panacagrimonas perspica]|nr:ATP-binding protein [Panacagrimonas perspica]